MGPGRIVEGGAGRQRLQPGLASLGVEKVECLLPEDSEIAGLGGARGIRQRDCEEHDETREASADHAMHHCEGAQIQPVGVPRQPRTLSPGCPGMGALCGLPGRVVPAWDDVAAAPVCSLSAPPSRCSTAAS